MLSNPRKVLIIAYRFPPQGGGGVQRTVKFVRYLHRFGWHPVVHTVQNPYWPLRDESLLQEIPAEVPVYRTRAFEFERLEKQLGSRFAKKAHPQLVSHQPQPPTSATDTTRQKRGTLASFRQLIHQRVLIPDPQIAWIPWALLKSLALMRRESIEVIYTSSPPNSTQILGLWLKKILKKPWVADFRDPWTDGVRRKQAYVHNRRRQRLEEAWERAIAERVDHFIVSTDKNAEQFVAKYPFLASKLSVLTNGFDPSDFEHISPKKKLLPEGHFHLTLTGNVETMFDAIPFFQAIKELVAENPEVAAHLRVNFVGTKRGKYDTYIQQHQLDRQINYISYVPHAESVQYLADSDALFLCQIPEYESAGVKLPGKLFEYLYMRKPVLALTLPGVTTSILERTGLGVVVNPNDVAGIKHAIHELYRQWHQGHWQYTPDDSVISTFDRIRLTERLATIFDAVAGRCETKGIGKPQSCMTEEEEHLEAR
jgi:glycosyltransferase involved in cell wall biosynthesis